MSFIQDFEDRVGEIDKYFEFLSLIDNLPQISHIHNLKGLRIVVEGNARSPLAGAISDAGIYAVTQDLRKILKATSFLLLYNLVEGSMTAALNDYFNALSVKRAPYQQLKPEIRALWLRYKHKLFEKRQPSEIVNALNNLFSEIFEILPKTHKSDDGPITVTDYAAYASMTGKTDFSGNLDAAKIRKLSQIYGFKLPTPDTCASLVTVKNRRNTLAHGNSTFLETGKESLEFLIKIKEETVFFMRSVLSAIDESIREEVFMAT